VAELDVELLDRAIDREVEFLQPARNLDRPAFIAEITLDLADDRRRRVRRELHAAFEIEAIDRLEQSDRTNLNQIVERFAAIRELDREIACQIEMRDDELVTQPIEFIEAGVVEAAIFFGVVAQHREACECDSRALAIPAFGLDRRNGAHN